MKHMNTILLKLLHTAFILLFAIKLLVAENDQKIDSLEKYKQMTIDFFLYDKRTQDLRLIFDGLQAYFSMKNPYDALNFYNEIIKHPNSLSTEQKKSILYHLIGFQYKLLRHYEIASKYFYLAKISSNKMNDLNASGWSEVDIGNLYYDYHQFNKANVHYTKAIEMFEKILKNRSKFSQANVTNAQLGIAVATENIGLSMIGMGKYDSAIYFIKKNEKYRLDPKQHYVNKQYYYLTVGATYFENQQYDSAFSYLNLSLKIKPQDNAKSIFPEYYKFQSQAQTYIGMYYLIKNQPRLAFQYFETSLKTAESFVFKEFLIQNYLRIIDFLLSRNMNLEAYKYLIRAKSVANSITISNSKNYDLLVATAKVYTMLNQILTSDMIDFKFHNIASTAGSSFKDFLEFINSAVSVAILGQANTSELPSKSGSRAALSVQKLITDDIMYSDIITFEKTVNSQLLAFSNIMNYGTNHPAYQFKVILDESEDYEKNAIIVREAVSAGIPLKKIEVYEKLGFTPPQDGDEILQTTAGY